jgi:hypothetical protein
MSLFFKKLATPTNRRGLLGDGSANARERTPRPREPGSFNRSFNNGVAHERFHYTTEGGL